MVLARVSQYPVTMGMLDWISHRYDAVDFGTYRYWFNRKVLAEPIKQYLDGKLPECAFDSILRVYNKRNSSNLRLEEITNPPDDTFAFSPEGDPIIFTDNFWGLIQCANGEMQNPIVALKTPKGSEVNWIILLDWAKDTLYAVKTPHVKGRRAITDQIAFGLREGELPSYVLPDEVHGLIQQENDYVS